MTETVASPAESAPAAPAPAATASPSPSPASGPAAAPVPAAAANTFNPLPVFFTIAGILIAGLVWVIRPLRASVARVAGRKTP